MNKIVVATTVVLLMGAPSSMAEPGPAISSLMNTPTSSFTFGMFRLDATIESVARDAAWAWKNGSVYAGASYDWDANRVDAYVRVIQDFSSKSEFETACSDVFFTLRSMAGVDTATGKPLFGEFSFFANYFGPIGYTNDKATSNRREVDKVISLLFSAKVTGSGYGKCTAPLLNSNYATSYSK